MSNPIMQTPDGISHYVTVFTSSKSLMKLRCFEVRRDATTHSLDPAIKYLWSAEENDRNTFSMPGYVDPHGRSHARFGPFVDVVTCLECLAAGQEKK